MKILKPFLKLNLLARVLLGLALGVFVGLFLGEPASGLGVIGTAYIRLLQMTVLPYILVSIVGGLGRINAKMAKKIGRCGGGLILFLWLTTMLLVLCLPLAYPNWVSAGFFSTPEQSSASVDLLTLYIPANPFYALANTIVPATVVFCLLLGIALISVPDKQGLLAILDNLSTALMRMASFVSKLAPIGIFAITASAAGTMQPEQVGRLEVFLLVYLTAWALLTFVFLPLLVAQATPISYLELLRQAGVAMVTALATGTVLIVLPIIAERCKALLAQHEMDSEESSSAVDVLVPTAYSFPSAGTLLGLGFVLFAAWFVGSPLSLAQYPGFTISGVLSACGGMPVAIPFMLDLLNLPADLFELYVLGSVITARLATALAALHGFAICLLVASAMSNRLSWRRLVQALALSLLGAATLLWGLGFLLTKTIPHQYKEGSLLASMGPAVAPVPTQWDAETTTLPASERERPRMRIVGERGTLRVGYLPDRLPFAFRNKSGDIVGYDMDLVNELARDFGLTLEVTPCNWETAGMSLREGRLDLVMGGLVATPERAAEFAFTHSYGDLTLALIVLDHRRDEFATRKPLRWVKDLRIAIPNTRYFDVPILERLPGIEIVPVESPLQFFRGEVENVDALAYSAEGGVPWTLLYPGFSVVIPKGLDVKMPVGFGLPRGQADFVTLMNTWLDLKTKQGVTRELYRYWFLGEGLTPDERRWSIMRNVLHWTD